MPTTIATAPINWHNEANPPAVIPMPYPHLLKDMVDAGYRATEWSPSLPGFAPALQRDLNHYGLEITGAYFATSLTHPNRHEGEIERAVELALFLKGLGGRYLVIGDKGDAARSALAGCVGAGDGLDAAAFAALTLGLNRIGEALVGTGVRSVVHPHVATYVETPEETLRVAEALDPALVGFCLDTGHCLYGGGDPRDVLEKLGRRVEYVHVKDVDRQILDGVRQEGLSFREALERIVFCELGRGCVDVVGFLRDLEALGYDGVIVLEQDTSRNPACSVRKNREYLSRMMGW